MAAVESWRRRGGRAPCSATAPRPSPAPGRPRASGSPFCARGSLAPPPRRPTRDPRAMSSGQRAGGDARKDGPAGGGVGLPATAAGAWAVSAVCLLLSVGSAAACLLLGAQAAALQGRVAALEEERELLRRAGSPSALAAWAEPHLERLLREVRGAGLGGGRGQRLGAGWAAVSRRRGRPSTRGLRGGRRLRVPVPEGVLASPLQPRGRARSRAQRPRETQAGRAASGTSRGEGEGGECLRA